MNRSIRHAFLAATTACGLWLAPATAQTTATTDPVGAVTRTIPAHQGSGVTLQLIDVPLQSEEFGSFVVNSVAGSTLFVNGVDFTSPEFPNLISTTFNGKPLYYAEVISGDNVGTRVDVVDVGSGSITLAEDVSQLNLTNQQFAILKYQTVGETFGEGDSSGVLSSASQPGEADIVYIVDSDGEFSSYYLYAIPSFLGGGERWVQIGEAVTVDASTARIYEETVLVGRYGESSRPSGELVFTGSVATNTQRVPLFSGLNLVNYRFPVDTTLQQSGLESANLLAGGSPDAADLVYVTTDGEFETFFLYSIPSFLGGGTRWVKVGEPVTNDFGAETISGPVLISKAGTQPLNWVQETPF